MRSLQPNKRMKPPSLQLASGLRLAAYPPPRYVLKNEKKIWKQNNSIRKVYLT